MEKYKLLNDVKAYYKVEDNIYIELTKEEFYMELYKLNERLQKRIDEAIEYIEKIQESENDINPYILHAPTLLNILKGEE